MNNIIETDPPRNDFDFFFDATLVANEILSLTDQFFITPTPGETNEAPAAPAPRIVGERRHLLRQHNIRTGA